MKSQLTLRNTVPGPGQLLGSDRVENGADDAALHDNLPEAGGLGCLEVIVQGILITADLSEEFDIGG